MTGKLIRAIILMLLIVFFIGFNLENRSDIRFWWGDKVVLKNVPIYFSFFVMYLIGVLSMLPILIASSRKRAGKKGKKTGELDTVDAQDKNVKKMRVLGAGKKKSKESDSGIGKAAGSNDGTQVQEPR
jgi:hypothetical protein